MGNRKRKMPEAEPSAFEISNHQSIQLGVNKHHLVDRLFHNSLFFHKYSKALSKMLREAELSGMPRFQHFYGHILLEILVDKCLLNEQADLAAKFYGRLQLVDKDELNGFLTEQGNAEHIDSFGESFSSFMSYRFLEKYLLEDGVRTALTRIAQHMHGYDLSGTEDVKKLDQLISDGIALITPAYPKIFSTLRMLCARDEI